MEMDEKKKRKKRTNSSSLIPEQSGSTVSERMIRSQLSDEEFLEDLNSLSHLIEIERQHTAEIAASKKIPRLMYQTFTPRRSLFCSGTPSVPVKSESSMSEPPDSHLQRTQRSQLSDEMSAANSLLKLQETLSQRTAPSAASEEIHALMPQPVWPFSRVSPSVSVKSYSSMNQPPSFHPQETQSEPLRETDSTASSVSVKSESSMFEPPDFHLQREQSELLSETDSTVSHVSMKSDSSMFEPPSFKLKRKQSEPLRETDSTVSHVSMKSDSSMYHPLYFKLKRKQSQLTEDSSSCSVCEEAVRDPVRLLCGHRSCKQCVCSFWDRYGSTADDPCKKCGKRFRGDQTDTEDDNKNLNLPSAPRPAPENTTEPVGREKRDQDLQSVLLEKTIKRVEMETEKLQAEKEKLQAEKEKSQAEKEKLQAEKEKFKLEKRKLALEIQLLEQQGKYTNYDHGNLTLDTLDMFPDFY
ncbi:uncharacterized protein [Pagrus major]|uniref:uncharacterized protein n=1 Tax=Pagrus major TaxID=143350 RepID=UPI003CC8B668